MHTRAAFPTLAATSLLVLTASACSSSTDPSSAQSSPEPSSAPTSTHARGADCYVQLYDADNFKTSDDHFELTSPGKYADLKNLPGADTDWTDEADSIQVGPAATVTIWSDTGFSGTSKKLDPGTKHAHVDPEPSSLKLTC